MKSTFSFFHMVLLICGVSGVGADEVSAMEGDSVTLHTNVTTSQQDRIRWYYNDIRIAQINRDLSKICTDVQCNEGNERFRDRLKLDHQTGSLTITNTRNTDSGEYKLQISSGSSESDKIFSVNVRGVSAAERDELKRKSLKEGESVTLDPQIKTPNYVMTWYFNDIRITDQSQICTNDQCKERFRDRLKLDHQTGSLTITNTRTEDSGEYQIQINSGRFSIIRSFSVNVTGSGMSSAVPGSGLSSAAVAGISVAVVLLVAAAAAFIYYRHRKSSKRKAGQKENGTLSNGHQGIGAEGSPFIPSGNYLNQTETLQMDVADGMTLNQN